MISLILKRLSTDWAASMIEADIHLRVPLSALQIGGGVGEARKINLLIFSQGQNKPDMVVKLMRDPHEATILEQEFDSLRQARALTDMAESFPYPLGLQEVNGQTVLLEQTVPGHSLEMGLARSGWWIGWHKKKLGLVADWLIEWQKKSGVGTVPFAGQTAVLPLLMQLPQRLDEKMERDLLAEAESYKGVSIPICAQHGDFWPGNIFIDEEKLFVIDWEDFANEQEPFRDLFTFAVSYGHSFPIYRWFGWSKAKRFEYSFLRPFTLSARLIRSWVKQIWRAYQLPNEAIDFFFILFLLRMSLPDQEETAKRSEQAAQWQKLFYQYINNRKRSIFYEQ